MSNRLLGVTAFCSIFLLNPAFSAPSLKDNSLISTTAASASIAKKVDLNQASAIQISNAINGVGKKRAQAIVDYRVQHGDYKTFDELAKVRGISKGFIAKERHQFDEKFYITIKKS